MKEVTEWDNRPRWMWVWDDNENDKHEEYVICILTEEEMKKGDVKFPVCAYSLNYKHCAEIEEEPKKETRLTKYELSQLLKCFGVFYTWGTKRCYENSIYFDSVDKDEEVPEDYKICYEQCELEEPTRETVWKWYDNDEYDTDIGRFVDFIGWGKKDKE